MELKPMKIELPKNVKELFDYLVTVPLDGYVDEKEVGKEKDKKTGQWKERKLKYLSWAWAWAIFKQACPTAQYKIKTFPDREGVAEVPYLFDYTLGYMVFTEVTAFDQTHIMWLPVMDGANRSMKDVPYEYGGEYKKTCQSATMFDINKAIMRCLVKNLAMFGLGLNIYAGEDLPTPVEEVAAEPCTAEQIAHMLRLKVKEGAGLKSQFGVELIKDLSYDDAEAVIALKEEALENTRKIAEKQAQMHLEDAKAPKGEEVADPSKTAVTGEIMHPIGKATE